MKKEINKNKKILGWQFFQHSLRSSSYILTGRNYSTEEVTDIKLLPSQENKEEEMRYPK